MSSELRLLSLCTRAYSVFVQESNTEYVTLYDRETHDGTKLTVGTSISKPKQVGFCMCLTMECICGCEDEPYRVVHCYSRI